MKSNSETPQETFTLLLEGSSGILEVEVGLFVWKDKTYLKPLSHEVISGTPPLLTRHRLQDALETLDWASRNAQVFEDGRVSAKS